MLLTKNKKKWEIFLVCFFSICCLLPFVDKAFHIDDTLFIYSARQILKTPIDFYGFPVNWYGRLDQAYNVIKNPPLLSYYLASIIFFFGESEIVLHTALLFPFVLLMVGIYFLARNLSKNPMLATFISLISPILLVSGTTVMCDVLMLMFYIWAIVFWINGLKNSNKKQLFLSSILISLCLLTKYFGITLIPILFLYTVFLQKRVTIDNIFLVVPILVLFLFDRISFFMYGTGLFLSAVNYSESIVFHNLISTFSKISKTFVFIGGGTIVAFFIILLNLPAYFFLFVFTMIVIYAFVLFFFLGYSFNISWQYSLFFISGVTLFCFSVFDFLKNKKPEAWLLLLITTSVILFVGGANWTINGRGVLPFAAISGILSVRYFYNGRMNKLKIGIILIIGLFCSMGIVKADYLLAETGKNVAVSIMKEYGKQNTTVFFEGHWGFQYYMERYRARALDYNNFSIKKGEIIVIPLNNTNLFPLRKDKFVLIKKIEKKNNSFFATMNNNEQAGFYSDIFGVLPFCIGCRTRNIYQIFQLKKL